MDDLPLCADAAHEPDSSPSTSDYDVGRHWSLTVTDPACAAAGACVWLGLDLINQVYYDRI